MAISKEITLDATGVVASYHVIQQLSIDALGKTASASLMSYVSADTYAAGKQPVQNAFAVFVQDVPGADEGAIKWMEGRLIEAQPETPDPAAASLPYMANRYVFAGGKIVS
jgi:hypothetical protein